MKINKILAVILLILFCVSLFGCGQSSNETKNSEQKKETVVTWAMGTSGSGSSPYVTGGVLCDINNKNNSSLKVSPQVTAGMIENVSLVNNKDIALGLTTSNELVDGYKDNPDIRPLFNYLIAPVHVVVDGRSDIYKIEDLKGKRVNISTPGQTTRKIAEAIMLVYGLDKDKGDYKTVALSTNEGIEAIKNGQVDATFVVAGAPMPGITEAAVTKAVRILPLEGTKADELNKAMGDCFTPFVIPAGMYKGTDAPVNVVAVAFQVIAHKDANVDSVYSFTKSIWDNLKQLQESHASFKDLKLDEIAIAGWGSIPIHPGAGKYFKEVGVIK